MRLTEQQQETLRAAVDRIIPADAHPGAWEAGVGNYLERQFEGDLGPVAADYGAGLSSLEAESVARFQQSFSSLCNEDQDTVLEFIEAGEVLTRWDVAPRRFFSLLVNTTAEGFYSDPQQGGNRSAVSWAMTGFEDTIH